MNCPHCNDPKCFGSCEARLRADPTARSGLAVFRIREAVHCTHAARVALHGGPGWWCAQCGCLGGPGGEYPPAIVVVAKELDAALVSLGAPPIAPATDSAPKNVIPIKPST